VDLPVIRVAVLLAAAACGRQAPPVPPDGVLDSTSARERGRAAYLENCALCHGVGADGHGVRQQALSGPPADFTSPAWRSGTTPGEVFATLREGVRGTSMPSWRGLSESTTWDIVAYLWSVDEDAP
jgi:mono/diheme cytochrome c family protein